MKFLGTAKQKLKAVCLVALGFVISVTYSFSQILPVGEIQQGWSFMTIDNFEDRFSNSTGEISHGFVTPIPCGKHYISRVGCFKFTPSNKEFEVRCIRTGQKHLLNSYTKTEKFWYENSWSDNNENGFLGEVNKLSTLNKPNASMVRGFKSGGQDVRKLETGTYHVVMASVIDCSPSPKLEPLILKTITTINPPKFPFTYSLEHGARENCLLAENFTSHSAIRHSFNRTQFYCLEVDSLIDAESIADSFQTAFSQKGARVSKYQYIDERTYYRAGLFAKQLAFTGLKRADVQMSVVSPEEIQVFYETMGSEPEIVAGKAAVVFAIDEMFERD